MPFASHFIASVGSSLLHPQLLSACRHAVLRLFHFLRHRMFASWMKGINSSKTECGAKACFATLWRKLKAVKQVSSGEQSLQTQATTASRFRKGQCHSMFPIAIRSKRILCFLFPDNPVSFSQLKLDSSFDQFHPCVFSWTREAEETKKTAKLLLESAGPSFLLITFGGTTKTAKCS